MKRTRWYKDGVFYQIWPRLFKDGNYQKYGKLSSKFYTCSRDDEALRNKSVPLEEVTTAQLCF